MPSKLGTAILLLSLFFWGLPDAVSQTVVPAGYYSGNVRCKDSNRGYADFVKWQIGTDGTWSNIFTSDEDGDYTDVEGLGSNYQVYTILAKVFSVGPNYCEPTTSLTIYSDRSFTAGVQCYAPGAETYTATCTGKLKYTSMRDNISISNSYGDYTSKCFNVKSPTRIQYGFEDSGGFYALFRLSAVACGSSKRRSLVLFEKYAESASKYGNVTLPAGRWRFQARSTDWWWAEGVPGVK